MFFMYTVLKVEKKNQARIDDLYKDDLVSRQTIIKREGVSLNLEPDYIYILIEGSEEAVKRAMEIGEKFSVKIEKNEIDSIYKKIKEQDESSLEGFGSIFG